MGKLTQLAEKTYGSISNADINIPVYTMQWKEGSWKGERGEGAARALYVCEKQLAFQYEMLQTT